MTSVEHKVAIHQLAAARRAAGKPIWAHRIRIGNLFHDDDLSFEEKRDTFVRLVKASAWYKGEEVFSDLHSLIEEMEDTEDVDAFDDVMSAVYDMADYDRVWIGR